jgi:CDP-diacylglycerol--glycerol-3-phosphate 3-phosphatidyltransferase
VQTSESFRFLRFTGNVAEGLSGALDKLALVLVRLGFSPNTLTVLGLAAGLAAGVFFGLGRPLWALLFLILCGVFDILDGKAAARLNAKSAFGAILDSTFDRYSEFFMYGGLAYHFRASWATWLGLLAFLGSTMVSYTRARAEGLGFDCRIGIMQRAERMILIGLASLLGSVFRVFDPAMIAALLLISLFSNITAVQRLFWVRKQERLRSGNRGEKADG